MGILYSKYMKPQSSKIKIRKFIIEKSDMNLGFYLCVQQSGSSGGSWLVLQEA